MSSMDLKIICKCAFIVIISVFIRAVMGNYIVGDDNTIFLESGGTMKSVPLYEEIRIINNESEFIKPIFNNSKELNGYVSEYIETNDCTKLDYNIERLRDNIVSVYLDCGNPNYKIYDMKSKKDVPFNDLLKDYDTYLGIVKKLLKLKYPSFVVDNIDFSSPIYNIKENEIVGYYNTTEYGNVSIRINYNEIKDLMKYDVEFDDAYENEIYTLDKNKKTIAFTFDDGPSSYDIDIINTLVDSHASATFFLVGNRLLNYSKSVNHMVDNNMEVGNHTYDHKSLVKLSMEKVKEEITKTNDIFHNMTNKEMKLLRPSYGAINKKVQKELNMPIILWDVDTLDWKTRDANKVYEVVMNDIEDGSIVLMHSLYPSTRDAVNMLMPALYKEGYQVVSVSKLAELKGVTLTNESRILSIK